MAKYQTNILDEKTSFKGEVFEQFIQESSPKIDTNDIVSFHECTFKHPVVLEKLNIKELSFINCKFEKEFHLIESEISIIGFTDCKFKVEFRLVSNKCSAYTVIRKINTPKARIKGNYQNLQIVSSTIKEIKIGDINSNSTKKDSKIEFLVDNKIGEVRIEPYSTYSYISFKGSIYEDIHFEGTFHNRIVFEKKVKCKQVFFESSICNYRIDFEEGNFETIYFYRSNFNGLVYINDFDGDNVVDFSRELLIEKLWLHSCTFDKDVTVSLSEINYITLSNNNFKQIFSFNNYLVRDKLEETDTVMISNNGTNRGTIIIERAYLDLSLGGINFGDIFIKDSVIWSLYLIDFDNKGSISLKEVDTGEYFTIHNSNSGQLNLINTDINKFKEVVIANSNIEGFETTNYPNNILSFSSDPKVGYGLSDKSKSRENLKSVYNQLKQIAKRKGDIHTAYKYQSLEYKQLLFSKRFGFDSILLFLNWISNGNGKSWSRGILFTLTIAFFFYWSYLSVLGRTLNANDWWKEYVLFISSFPKLTLEKYAYANSEWLVSLIIWLARIFISYGIYQTVAAFRKYGK